MIVWRLLLLSGLISLFIGILYVSSLLETVSNGLDTWGYSILFWGILGTFISFNRFHKLWLIKGTALIGVVLHGSLTAYGMLFPEGAIFYGLGSILVTVFCMTILGANVKKTPTR